MLKVGDKIKYVKANYLIEMPIGTVMDITDIQGGLVGVNADYKVNGRVIGKIQGLITYNEVEKYFEKVIETEPKRVWTEWKEITVKTKDDIIECKSSHCDSCVYYGVCGKVRHAEYRTNGKKVRVRYKVDDNKYIIGESTCHKSDTFDLIKGLKVACGRLSVKLAQYHLDTIIKKVG